MIAAFAFALVLALLLCFQLALAFGAPWGHLAWGGQNTGTLPTGYRIGSAVSVLVYAPMAFVALDRAEVIDVLPDGVSSVAMWVIFGILALGVVMNAISRSRAERLVMTPVAILLAVLALLTAL